MHPTTALTPVIPAEEASIVPGASSRATAPAAILGAPNAAAASLTPSASVSTTPGAAASSTNTKAQKKQKETFTTITTETLKASKNASRYMDTFKVVGSQESVHGLIAKQ